MLNEEVNATETLRHGLSRIGSLAHFQIFTFPHPHILTNIEQGTRNFE